MECTEIELSRSPQLCALEPRSCGLRGGRLSTVGRLRSGAGRAGGVFHTPGAQPAAPRSTHGQLPAAQRSTHGQLPAALRDPSLLWSIEANHGHFSKQLKCSELARDSTAPLMCPGAHATSKVTSSITLFFRQHSFRRAERTHTHTCRCVCICRVHIHVDISVDFCVEFTLII